MKYTLNDIRNKEVINIRSGSKIGYVDDIEFDAESLTVKSLIIYGRGRFLGFFGRDDDVVIKCRDIEIIGTDTILVSTNEVISPKTVDVKVKSLCK
ncbi:MAG: YlmC/YmxH family sporulation protein [Oscillospiraceae bacterium]